MGSAAPPGWLCVWLELSAALGGDATAHLSLSQPHAFLLCLCCSASAAVLGLGDVEWLHPAFHHEKCIYPVGYRALRSTSECPGVVFLREAIRYHTIH